MTTRSLRRMLLDKQVEHRVPGIVGGVVQDGELGWSAGVGCSDIDVPDRPPGADTQFLIASISKTFTAVLVMALRDEGRLKLDDTLDVHLPETTHPDVTLRQLLTHASGMQREPVGDVWDTLRFPDRTALVEGWNAAERIGRPHHRFHYSNLCFSLLGEVVVRLDGREWIASVQARILDPLGMRRTSLGLADGETAAGYYVPPCTDVPVSEPALDIAAMAAAGGLASTATDLATWAGFWADPSADVLHPDTVDEMCHPGLVVDPEGWQAAQGLGVVHVRHGGRVFTGHTGGMPGHITGMFVERETGTGAVVLMNSTSAPDPAALAIDLAAYVLDNDPAEPEPWVPGTIVPAELKPVLGTWFSEGRAFTFSVRQGRLEGRLDDAPKHLPPSVFVELEPDLFRTESGREVGELLRVTRDDSGAVIRLNWATYPFTREPYAFGEWLTGSNEPG